MPDDLDPQLVALVRSVARRTRLRRAERADVERELASHFREALAARRSPEEAITTFGDPKTAARDLRAAAIAKRSPLDRAFGR
ncbi:MAG: HAAS signaling domain-containing protein, partial [Phycisphaerales bacterium]